MEPGACAHGAKGLGQIVQCSKFNVQSQKEVVSSEL